MARIWSDEGKLERWLEVELAALDAWAEVGAAPPEAAQEIRANARPPSPARVAELEERTQHDLAAFVDAVAAELGPAGRWLHYGLTSSDVVDTALALQLQEAGRLILRGLDRAFEGVLARADEHRSTLTIGRTHGVHAEPTTFGLKLAVWAFELDRARRRVAHALEGVRVGKLSGAVGTYDATDPEVERLACERLGLEPAPAATQIVQRDRHAELPAAFLALDYMLDRFAWLVEGLVVRPDRMRRNLDAGRGLFFSQRLLLALVGAGLPRGEAYRLVQSHAMRAWEQERDFPDLIRADPDVTRLLDAGALEAVFDLESYTRHVDTVFERLHALVPQAEPVHACRRPRRERQGPRALCARRRAAHARGERPHLGLRRRPADRDSRQGPHADGALRVLVRAHA